VPHNSRWWWPENAEPLNLLEHDANCLELRWRTMGDNEQGELERIKHLVVRSVAKNSSL
jgi:hypothetical protein